MSSLDLSQQIDAFKKEKKAFWKGEMRGDRGRIHISIFYELDQEKYGAQWIIFFMLLLEMLSQRVSQSNLSAHIAMTQSASVVEEDLRRTVTNQKIA